MCPSWGGWRDAAPGQRPEGRTDPPQKVGDGEKQVPQGTRDKGQTSSLPAPGRGDHGQGVAPHCPTDKLSQVTASWGLTVRWGCGEVGSKVPPSSEFGDPR